MSESGRIEAEIEELVELFRSLMKRRASRGKLVVLKVLAVEGRCMTYSDLYHPYTREALRWWLRPRSFKSFKVLVRDMAKEGLVCVVHRRQPGGMFAESKICLADDREAVLRALEEVGMSEPPDPDVDPKRDPIDVYVRKLMDAGLVLPWKRNVTSVLSYLQKKYEMSTEEMLKLAGTNPNILVERLMDMGYSVPTAQEAIRTLVEASGFYVRTVSLAASPRGGLRVVVQW